MRPAPPSTNALGRRLASCIASIVLAASVLACEERVKLKVKVRTAEPAAVEPAETSTTPALP